MDSLVPISGLVRSSDDHPIANARVEVHDIHTRAIVASALTFANGTFVLAALPPGNYEIVAYSGIAEIHERLNTSFAAANSIVLHLPNTNPSAGNGGQQTVSVHQLKVPGRAQDELRKARSEVDKGKLDDARKHLDAAIATYPNFADALTLRGIISLQEQKFDAALADLEKAIAAEPSTGLPYIVMGAAYNSLGQFDNAARALQHGTALSPNFWQAHFEFARTYLAKGNFEAALAQAGQAEQLAPKEFSSLHLVKAYALLGLKQYAEAVPEFEQYLSNDPQGPNAVEARRTLDGVKASAAGTR